MQSHNLTQSQSLTGPLTPPREVAFYWMLLNFVPTTAGTNSEIDALLVNSEAPNMAILLLFPCLLNK